MNGCYVGRVAVDDPLHPILCRVVGEGMGVTKVRSFDAFRLNGSNEVYGYEECGSGVKLVCKFFGRRFGWDRKRAAWTADREYHSYKELRRYELVGSPHHVIRPLALEPGINCALVLEYYGGEQLSRAIDGAIHAGDEERLYDRLRRWASTSPPSTTARPTARASTSPKTAPTSTPSSPRCAGSAGSGRGTRTSSGGCRACGGCASGCGPTSRCGCTATPRPRTSSSAAAWTSARSTWSG